MKQGYSKTIPAELAALTRCMEETGEFLSTQGAPEEAVFAAQLALEEIITNIIKYGYGSECQKEIDVSLMLEGSEFSLAIADGAGAFDPFRQEEPDLSLPAEERPIGGLGIHLVKSLMTHCAYCRENGKNRVTLTKAW